MDAQTVQAIQQALAPVAEKIGQGAMFAWEVVVRQQTVIGYAELIGSVFAYVCAITITVVAFSLSKKIKELEAKGERHDASDWRFGKVSLHMLAFVPAGLGTLFLTSAVMRIMNPEYYALEFFITLGKSAVGG